MGLLIRAAALVAILAVGGCGGGASGGEGDPARAVPADAPFYLELVVRPSGSVRRDALAAASKVLATGDPEARIRELLERAVAARGEDVDYERDLQPWLGERAALWSEPSDGTMVLLATTDADAARESLESILARGGHEVGERSHRDSRYLVDRSGVAAGLVDDLVVIGPEALYRRTVDAAEGDSLAETDRYADAVDRLPGARLGMFWTDTAALLDLAARDDPTIGQIRSLVPEDELPAVVGALLADGDRLALEAEVSGGVAVRGTPLVQELPGDTWMAIGVADVGQSVRGALDRFAGPLGGVAIRGRLRRATGLDLDRDLLDWIGHAGVFVRGTSPGTIDGGIVVRPTDPARAEDAFGRIVGAVQQDRGVAARPVAIEGADQAFALEAPGSRRPIVLARGSERVVVTAGEAAAAAALGVGDRLGESELYAQAAELAGVEPALLVSVPQLLELVDDEARRHLEPFSVIAAGFEEDDARIAAGLR